MFLMQYRCLSNLIWILNKAQKLDFMPYYVVASLILISQIFGHLLDVATLLWLYATERKCCEELAMHSSLTMALCNRALCDQVAQTFENVLLLLQYKMSDQLNIYMLQVGK